MEKYNRIVKTEEDREKVPSNVVSVNVLTQIKSWVRNILKQFK